MVRELFSTGPGQVSIDIVFRRAMLRNEFRLSMQFLITSSVDATEVESFSTLRQKRWLRQSVSKIAVIFELLFLWRYFDLERGLV